MKKFKINPEYLKAKYLILWIHPNAPSFSEQIELDRKTQETLERELKEQQKLESKTP